MLGEKKDQRKTTLENSCWKISSPESEPLRKGSKSGDPAESGRYHMYALITFGDDLVFPPTVFVYVRVNPRYTRCEIMYIASHNQEHSEF